VDRLGPIQYYHIIKCIDRKKVIMDSLSFSSYAAKLQALPGDSYPAFDVCHIILCCLAVRKETGRDFAWDRPVGTWACCMIASFAGSLIANPLLGKPILAAFSNEHLLLLATIIYLVTFFFPGDIGYKFVKLMPVYATVCTIKEIYRALKISKGLKEGASFKSDSIFIPVLIATIKGNGSGFMTPITRVVRGEWKPAANEIFKPSVTTKMCFIVGLALCVLDDKINDLIYLAAVGLFVSVKLASVFGEPIDPIKPLENVLFRLLGHVSQDAKEKGE